MAAFGVGGAALTVCNALKKRDKYIEVSALTGFRKVLNEAYRLDPRLTGCVAQWSGKQVRSGALGINRTYRLELTYDKNMVSDIEQVIIDDGKWKPSDTLSKLSELPPALQIITSDLNGLRKRIDDDYAYLKENYRGLRSVNYEWNEESHNGVRCFWVLFVYTIDTARYQMYNTLATREMERISKQFFGKGTIPVVIKVFLVFSYLQQTCAYDQESSDLISAELYDALQRPWVTLPYGPLVKKLGVCEGIAAAFKQFMDFYGIKNRLVFGKLNGSEAEHCWNIVCINDGYYHVDATSGISGDGIYIGAFLKDDASMSLHYFWDMSSYPQCNSRQFDFDVVETYIHDHLDDLTRMEVEEKFLCPDEIRE